MNFIQAIRISLANNTNLTDDLRNKIYNLVTILNKKIPEVNLSRLNQKLGTVQIKKMGILERKGVYTYDVRKNIIYFSKKLEGNYDIDHLLMKAILEMTTSTNTFTGFNSDERLYALNLAYTEILANYIIGNEGETELEEEMIITNLLSYIIGKDTLFNSYFTNNGDPIIKALEEAEVGML